MLLQPGPIMAYTRTFQHVTFQKNWCNIYIVNIRKLDAVHMCPSSGGQSIPLDNMCIPRGWSEYCWIVSLLHTHFPGYGLWKLHECSQSLGIYGCRTKHKKNQMTILENEYLFHRYIKLSERSSSSILFHHICHICFSMDQRWHLC